MQIVFQLDVHKDFDNPDLKKYIGDKKTGNQHAYICSLINAISSNIDKIDEKINKCSENWTVTRMSKPDLAIIRTAVGEMLYMEEIPFSVSINEAVNLAKTYGAEQSPKFVNAVLAKIENVK